MPFGIPRDFQDKTPALNRLATDKFVLSYNTYYRGLILVILKILKILVQTTEYVTTQNKFYYFKLTDQGQK